MADPDDDFATLFEQSMATGSAKVPRPRERRLKAGQVVDGTVVAISDDTIFVDVGTKSEARLDKGDLEVAVGDTIRATVSHPGGREPPQLVVSLSGASLRAADLELAVGSGTPVEGEITKAVKAGVEVDVSGLRAFCPASQVELGYVADLETFVGQKHFFRVLEVRDNGRSIVLSRKALLIAEREQKAAELAGRLSEGAELDGIVQTIQPYGVFVDIGGLQGLVHVSEMTHGRVTSPSDVVSVGESVRVKVLSIESAASGKPKDMRISLSMKALVQPTADEAAQGGETDDVVTATVVKVEGYGVLVDTPAGQGLVPNAELALPPGSDPRRAFSAGDTLEVVFQRREGSGRLRFSAKAVEEAEARRNYRQFRQGQRKGNKGGLGSLGELLQGLDLPDGPNAAGAKTGAAPKASKAATSGTGSGSGSPGPRKGRRRKV